MSLTVRVVPCLDVAAGRVVKGVRFTEIRDAGDPVQVAAGYERQGADELVFLDITASHERRDTMLPMVQAVAAEVFMPLTVGGGVRSVADVRALLQAGADKVAINTAAVENPDLVTEAARRFGCQCIVVAIDAKSSDATASGWEIFTHGGRRSTGLDAVDWARNMAERGAGELLLTSMDRDGTRDGYDLPLTEAVCAAVSVPVVASGGVGCLAHLLQGAQAGASAVLAASIFHYGEHTVAEAKACLQHGGMPVRL